METEISAPPESGPSNACRNRQSSDDLAEHLATCGVADRVVDRLEIVDVRIHDHGEASGSRNVESVAKLAGEALAVEPPGQRVLRRLVGQDSLELLAISEVVALDDDVRDPS